MNWQDLQKMLIASPTYQELPDDFRQKIEGQLPGCDAEQLQQVQLILEQDRENISDFMEASRAYQKDTKKKNLGLEELLDHQKEMETFDAANGLL